MSGWLAGAASLIAAGVGALGEPFASHGASTASTFECQVTRLNGISPEGAPPSLTNHTTGALMVRLWPAGPVSDVRLIQDDGSVAIKLGWWRSVAGTLTISGRRLDADAPALVGRTAPADAYPPIGFIPSGLYFATRGCWEVSGRLGDDELSFVVDVRVGREARPIPEARLLPPRAGADLVLLRWRSNVLEGQRVDLTLRRTGAGWRLLERRLSGSSYELRTRRPGRYEVRVRAHDAFGAGSWSTPRAFTVSAASTRAVTAQAGG